MPDERTTPRETEKSRRSRRELLFGAAGALAALGAQPLIAAAPARAADGDAVILGAANTESNLTSITSTGSGGGMKVEVTSVTNPALDFVNHLGDGLYGQSVGGTGVTGTSTNATGVAGTSSGNRAGVNGQSASGEGVYGQSGTTPGTTPGQTKHGIHGATDAGGFAGIFGEFVGGGVGAAVQGNNVTGSGQGVVGVGETGVLGLAIGGGTGVLASEAFDGTGLALEAIGPAQFSLSGVVTIAAGKKSASVTGVPLRAGSLALATVQDGSGVWVVSAVPSVAKSKITIDLNAAVPAGKTAHVAWFVVN